jgi:hypothetical protein
MPKLVDLGVRFEFIREAVVRVAARDGGAAVTIASVAAELRVSGSTLRRTLDSSAALPGLGVVWIERLRQYSRYGALKSFEVETVARVVGAIRCELPSNEEELECERAWAELTGVGAAGRCRELRDGHNEHLDRLAAAAGARLVLDGERREFEATRLRALLDGLIAAVCRGSLSLEQMHAVFERHMAELVRQTEPEPQVASPECPFSPDAAGSPR